MPTTTRVVQLSQISRRRSARLATKEQARRFDSDSSSQARSDDESVASQMSQTSVNDYTSEGSSFSTRAKSRRQKTSARRNFKGRRRGARSLEPSTYTPDGSACMANVSGTSDEVTRRIDELTMRLEMLVAPEEFREKRRSITDIPALTIISCGLIEEILALENDCEVRLIDSLRRTWVVRFKQESETIRVFVCCSAGWLFVCFY